MNQDDSCEPQLDLFGGGYCQDCLARLPDGEVNCPKCAAELAPVYDIECERAKRLELDQYGRLRHRK